MFYFKENKNDFKIDLLSGCQGMQKRSLPFFRSKYTWKILSGKWYRTSTNQVIHLSEIEVKWGEGIAIIYFPKLNGYHLQARFKILSESIKPPEGGPILYLLFKNIKNYYSIHFCLFKQRIEFIKRFKGIWTTIAEQSYPFEILRDYSISIRTRSGMHVCQIDGTKLIEVCDRDFSKGCIGIGAKYCDIEFNYLSLSLPSNDLHSSHFNIED